ncbi:MAG: hypothetical protein JOZ53_21135 [Planctomycetaceae bacterium]|nr:hypothetical protein [Planctomycetaceae bacterium]
MGEQHPDGPPLPEVHPRIWCWSRTVSSSPTANRSWGPDDAFTHLGNRPGLRVRVQELAGAVQQWEKSRPAILAQT